MSKFARYLRPRISVPSSLPSSGRKKSAFARKCRNKSWRRLESNGVRQTLIKPRRRRC